MAPPRDHVAREYRSALRSHDSAVFLPHFILRADVGGAVRVRVAADCHSEETANLRWIYAAGGIYHGQLLAQRRLGQVASILEFRAVMGLFSEGEDAGVFQRKSCLGKLRAARIHRTTPLADYMEGQNPTEAMAGSA